MTMPARSDARTWVRSRFRGYFTVLYTPFDAAGEIDERALRSNVELTLSLPGSRHRIPAPFRRWPTTCLQAASTGPDPIRQPWAR